MILTIRLGLLSFDPGTTIQEKPSKPPTRPPVAGEEFPGLGPSNGPLHLGSKGNHNSKKNKKKQNNSNNNSSSGAASQRQPAEPASLSSIADFLGKSYSVAMYL